MRSDSQYAGRSRRNHGGRRDDRRRSESRPRPAPKPLTLWQRIVAVFTGNGGKPKPQNGHRYENAPDANRHRSEPERQNFSRKPEIVEVNSPKLYVGNLSFDATESDLFELFNGVGQVQNAEVVANKYTQKSKGFAFVTMQTIDEAKRAVSELHDKDFMGRKLVVSGAKVNDMRDVA